MLQKQNKSTQHFFQNS